MWHVAETTWGTPLLIKRDAVSYDFSQDLLGLIDRQHGPVSHVGVSNGEKSSLALLHDCLKNGVPLAEHVLDWANEMNAHLVGEAAASLSDAMIAEAWAVSYDNGGDHSIHAHHDSVWSGVLYLKTGGMDEGTGAIQFMDPRPAFVARSTSPGGNVYSVDPEERMAVVFPSWLAHRVTEVVTRSKRVCVAFNVAFDRDRF